MSIRTTTTTKIATWLTSTGVLLITAVASSSTYAGDLIPFITDMSTPQFSHNVKLSANRGNWTGRTNNGNKDFTFNDGIEIWDGDGFKFNFTAEFDDTNGPNHGDFLSGSMSIQGSIAGLGIMDKKTVLMSADLSSFNYLPNSNWLGFNTTNIVCDSGLGVFCTNAESVIFETAMLLGGPGSFDTTSRFNTTATATTSVPLPAAVWLFGAGLGLVGMIARRRKGETGAV